MSAEFLMGEVDERAAVEGTENPAFDGGYSAELSASQASAGREIQPDRQDSTLAAHQQKMELRAPAKSRVSTGNERDRNYFDPSLVRETNPRRCRTTEDGAEDEPELKIMNEDEKHLYQKMTEMLDAETTFMNLPVLAQRPGDPAPRAGSTGHGRFMAGVAESEEEVIPRYAQQLRELPDMITLGSLSLEQVPQGQAHRADHQLGRTRQHRQLEAVLGAESRLLKAPGERKGEVIAKYDEMTEAASMAEPPWAREPGPGWQVDRGPQPVEVFVRCLRAIRDKLQRGQYSISVDLHGHLGVPAITWSRPKEEQWARLTEPVEHGGRFYDTELHVNQSVFTILPAPCDLRPSMVLLFRLYGLPGGQSHVGTTLGWAAFPICRASLTSVQGRFKTPFIRGHPHPDLNQFRKIEALMSSDLDNWLCNMYFEVKNLPTGSSRGQEERSVTLQIPPQAPQPGPSSASPGRERIAVELPTTAMCHRGSPLHLPNSHSSSACSSPTLPGKTSTGTIPENEERRGGASTGKDKTRMHCKPQQKEPINKMNGLRPGVGGEQGDKRATTAQAAGPGDHLSPEDMEEYTFSLQPVRGPAGVPGSGSGGGATERARLVLRMLPSELGLSPLRRGWCLHSSSAAAARLGLIMPLLALIWFVRLYLHYCSQWLFLQAIAVPVNKFQFYAHTVELVYQNSLLHTREELAMVVVGPLTLNAATMLLLLIRWACQLAFGSLPSFTSDFIMALGVWTLLDPLAVFAVDAILGRLSYSSEWPVADAAKLYWHFYRTVGSGAAGVVITVFVYSVLFLLSSTILYLYFLRLHNEGRMLDIFQRLSAVEGAFFVPCDLEVSIQEVDYIVQKAEQWRGFNGERRKQQHVCMYMFAACAAASETTS
ncbi:uncharacterized protein ofcc1 isoform X2 [Esox lucius]|uniref:uncharacterized protein ofcc1 isoform X2 n=1 Tax=Esox lucius TaxID=8010 RepID=UPI00147727A2|nr:uncharacterized protein ofcc1 isoform X2 [Esox lucius]